MSTRSRIVVAILTTGELAAMNLHAGSDAPGDPAGGGSVAVFYHDTFLLHDTGPEHPESPDRLKAVLRAVDAAGLKGRLSWPRFAPANLDQIGAVHTPAYMETVRRAVLSGAGRLPTGDTPVSSRSWDAALLAAGAAVAACDHVVTGGVGSAFCLVRPPGHHATADRGMGFCVFNNAAVAARHLQRTRGIRRILIADFDVHHGNGTQEIFYGDDSVYYFSVHQRGIYPGTGRENETGAGKGTGATLNVELETGNGDAPAIAAFRERLKPAMQRFKPEFVLVSAGFDAHRDDPLGSLTYTEEGYAGIARELVAIADAHARGRIVFVLEGGYGLPGMSESVVAILKVLLERQHP